MPSKFKNMVLNSPTKLFFTKHEEFFQFAAIHMPIMHHYLVNKYISLLSRFKLLNNLVTFNNLFPQL